MKIITMVSFAFVLAACASTDYSEFGISEAVLTNLEVEETHDLEKRKHEIHVSFDYSISDFHADQDLYYCTVQFAGEDGTSVTLTEGSISRCKLEEAVGSVSISWPTPLDKTFNGSESLLSKIKYPLEYYVAIHQRTGGLTTRIIASSEMIASTIDI